MKLQRLVLIIVSFLFSSCFDFDRTPADIHDELVPRIAADLLRSGTSPLLRKQPENYKEILSQPETIRWDQKAIKGISGEGIITFYRMPENHPILCIGFDLHEDMKSYIFHEAKK
jgi:hypothetical protein